MFLATPALIRAITPRLGRILGPRGLMPSERRGTVTDDIAGYIRRLQGTNEWKGDKVGTIRAPIAKVSSSVVSLQNCTSCGQLHFPVTDVIRNVRHFLSVVKRTTGNSRDFVADKKSNKGGPRPGALNHLPFPPRSN